MATIVVNLRPMPGRQSGILKMFHHDPEAKTVVLCGSAGTAFSTAFSNLFFRLSCLHMAGRWIVLLCGRGPQVEGVIERP